MPSRAAQASVHSQPGCQSNGALTSCSSGVPSSRCCRAQRLAEWAMTSTRSPVVVAAHVVEEAGRRVDDVAVALPARERRVDVVEAHAVELGDGPPLSVP